MNPRMRRLAERWANCERCRLHLTRNRYVHGRGDSLFATVLFLGEGPGRDEDRLGKPFVGRAGCLLQRVLDMLGFTEYYIANLVGCWPPSNRVPRPDEIRACRKRLEQIAATLPLRCVVTLGGSAGKALIPGFGQITKERGEFHGVIRLGRKVLPVLPTFHPSYLLRQGGEKSGEPWELFVRDIRLAAKER